MFCKHSLHPQVFPKPVNNPLSVENVVLFVLTGWKSQNSDRGWPQVQPCVICSCQTLHLHVPKLDKRVTGHSYWRWEPLKRDFDRKINRNRIDYGNVHAVVGCGCHSWMVFLLHYAIPLSEDRPRPLQTNALMPSHETNPIWPCWIKVYLEEVPMAFHMIYRLLS